ncbi:SsgA family sporulation/cell division regulator [Streptomyces sp. NPDC101166]|uniref:SsgA family sporulation/cell division regulator n=1 Tax=Streptomyces sp. NPDC101166 TaxID=3366120 RepID=UPI0038159D96
MRPTVVERELELGLVLSPELSVPVPARLGYRSDDPFAVHLTFHIHSERPVHWTFARELMVEGVFRPCGQADVRVWPTKADGRGVVMMALSSPAGDALLEAPAEQVTAWLERTLRAVPPGTEAARLGLDDALTELFAPAWDDLWLCDQWLSEPGPGSGAGPSSDEPRDGA